MLITKVSPEQYLEADRKAETKSEYYRGEIVAMAGVGREHNRITRNILIRVGTQLEGKPCEAFVSDMRVKSAEDSLYAYPDVAIVCGEANFVDTGLDTLTNPTVIVEVLSDSTQSRDRGEKFALYQSIESLQEYLLISQTEPRVELFTRQITGQWLLSIFIGLDAVVELISISCSLRLRDIYNRVVFDGG